MQSNNPVFRRSEEFQSGGQNAYGNQSYAGNGGTYQAYGEQPAQAQYGQFNGPQTPQQAPPGTGARMTIDSVVQATGISLGVVILTALATWILTPDLTNGDTTENLGPLFAAMTIGSLGAFGLSMVNSFKRNVSPALVLAFAALEGVALGAISKLFNMVYEGNVVMGAVIGTFAAFAGTLTAYKVLNIKVGDKFRMFVVAAMFGMVGLSLMELVLGMFGAQIGLFGVSGLGMVTAVAGLVLGVFMLIMDFDFIEQGVANGLPEKESWRAAFAMTVSLVWIYTNLLRILAFFSDN